MFDRLVAGHASIENQVGGDHSGAAAHAGVAVDQHALVRRLERLMDFACGDGDMLPKQVVPLWTVVNGNSVRWNVVPERCVDVSGTVDDETNVVVAHKGFIGGRGDSADPHAIQDVAWRKHGCMVERDLFLMWNHDAVRVPGAQRGRRVGVPGCLRHLVSHELNGILDRHAPAKNKVPGHHGGSAARGVDTVNNHALLGGCQEMVDGGGHTRNVVEEECIAVNVPHHRNSVRWNRFCKWTLDMVGGVHHHTDIVAFHK